MDCLLLDSSREEVLESLRESGREVIIFGAGRLGNAALAAARFFGVNVVAFCDNNVNLQGETIRGIPVFSPGEATNKFPGAYFLIAMLQLLSILPQLRELGIAGRCLTLDMVARITNEGGPPVAEALARPLRLACYTQQSLVGGKRIFLGSASLMVSERCSLKCRHCSNLTPYFKHPAKWTADYLLDTLDSFLNRVDGVEDLRLMGGDAMTHADICTVAKEALRRPKINNVIVYTNAVIPLDKNIWKSVENRERLFFNVTEYGLPNQNIAVFSEQVQTLGFKMIVTRCESWCEIDIGEKRRADAAENRRIFAACSSAVCTNVYDGKVYRCAIAPAAIRQGILPGHDGDRIVIHGSGGATKEELWKFLFEKSSMDACAYCTGNLPGERPEIPVAEQIAEKGRNGE